MSVSHFLDVTDLTADELATVLDLAEKPDLGRPLEGRGAALLFEHPSLRTRSSAELAVVQLGGHPVTIGRDEVGLDRRETVEDVARVLSGYHAVIGARVTDHRTLERLASAATVPVVNLLSDRSHPCQALADLLTLRQCLGDLAGRRVAWVGDWNNVSRSLAEGATLAGMTVSVSCPSGHGPEPVELDRLAALGARLTVADRPEGAVDGADAVCTDVWTSMGHESDADARRRAFEGFTVDDRLLAGAAPEAVFLHCLPAHRGEEVTAEVLEGSRSRVWQQAENRMHATRGLLAWLLR